MRRRNRRGIVLLSLVVFLGTVALMLSIRETDQTAVLARRAYQGASRLRLRTLAVTALGHRRDRPDETVECSTGTVTLRRSVPKSSAGPGGPSSFEKGTVKVKVVGHRQGRMVEHSLELPLK